MVGNFQVLDFQTFGRVQKQYDDLGKIDGVSRIGHRQLFKLVLHLGALAHPCRIDQAHAPFGQHRGDIAFFIGLALFRAWVVPDPVHRNTVAGNPRLRAGNQTVLAQNLVNERRFACVRAANNGHLQYRVRCFGVGHFKCTAVDMRQQRLEQVGHAFAMFAADRNRVAKAKRVAFQYAVIALLALGLVHGQHDRGRAAAQPTGDFFIERGDADTAIDQEQRNLRAGNRSLGLHPHPAGQGIGIFILITCGIDNGEFKIEQATFALTPVAGDARRVVDKRQLFANQTVEQS